MPTISIGNFQGINTNLNPMSLQDGQVIQANNLVQTPFGAYTKRGGYNFYQSTPDNQQVNSLFAWYRADGQTFNTYRASGTNLYYSSQGTGAWTACGNGSISAGAHVGQAILNDVMIIGDGVNQSRYSTNGTSFTNISNAPISQFFLTYQQRAYALGTGVAFAYSSANDATNWNTGGTSDSATFDIGGEGSVSYLFKNSDRVQFIMSGRHEMFQWDGVNLVDLVNDIGPTSPYSFAQTENLSFWVNRLGVYTYSGSAPQIISNPIERMVHTINGGNWGTVPGETHLYDYFAAVGTIVDDFTGGTVSNAILKYDIRQNAWSTWQLHDPPTAMLSFVDAGLDKKFIFGGTQGQCFSYDDNLTTDNGTPIEATLQFLLHAHTLNPKNWYRYQFIVNPGCEAKFEAAISSNLSDNAKVWFPLNQAVDGVVNGRFPSGRSQGEFLFIKITDNSVTSPFQIFGAEIDFEIVQRK